MLRAVDVLDEPTLVALNEANVVATAPMSPVELRQLLSTAFRVRVHGAPGQANAFLIALDQTSRSDSANFGWFRERVPRFVYVDRVVVAEQARRTGIAQALYRDLMSAMRVAGQQVLCCEVNLTPANPTSDAFHEAMGFSEMGRAILPGGTKTVRYLTKVVAP